MVRKRLPSFSTSLFFIGSIALLIIILQLLHLTDAVTGVVSNVLSPVQSRLYRLTHRSSTTDAAVENLSKEDLLAKYRTLSDQYNTTTVALAESRALLQETQQASAQLSFLTERNMQGIPAQVTGRSLSDGLSTITVNRGAKHGVTVGEPVIADNGALLGVISQVDGDSSFIRLITGPESKVSAVIQNEKRSPGIVSGDFNVALFLDYIPQFDVVQVGEIVATSGQDALIPAGLPIGTIEAVEGAKTALFQRAAVRPLADGEKASLVTIVLQ